MANIIFWIYFGYHKVASSRPVNFYLFWPKVTVNNAWTVKIEVVDPGSGPRGPLPKSQFSRDTTGWNFLNNRIAKVTTGDKNCTYLFERSPQETIFENDFKGSPQVWYFWKLTEGTPLVWKSCQYGYNLKTQPMETCFL